MSCAHCVNAVEGIVLAMDGTENVEINLSSKEAVVQYNQEAINVQTIVQGINKTGNYKAIEK